MEVTNEPVEWDLQEDFEILRQFLNTRTGKRLVPKILEDVPGLLPKGDLNEILIRSGEVRGWQAAIRTLLLLANPPAKETPAEAPSSYPAPEDDSQWNDGQKLNANTNPNPQ